jgi:CDP-diacylglycerol---serine O-phosphatidyltransferase
VKILKHIPNAITSGNLLCGCLAIVQIFSGDLVLASFFVFLAAVLDFFDGFAARMLKVNSPIGKDLDSLADVVTFGVVPGLMVYRLLQFSLIGMEEKELFWIALQKNISSIELSNVQYLSGFYAYLPYFGFLITVFSAIRLAKFNNDTRQSTTFIGLPTPANAILIAALVLNLQQPTAIYGVFSDYRVLLGFTVLSSYALVAELPLLALKFKDFAWKTNAMRYVFLGFSAVLLVVFKVQALPLLILCYILFSLVNNIFFKAQH